MLKPVYEANENLRNVDRQNLVNNMSLFDMASIMFFAFPPPFWKCFNACRTCIDNEVCHLINNIIFH